jgi:predicted nucleic acid-binding protein
VNNVRYGILDTGVLIDVDKIEASELPDESYVTTVSLAELAAGPHAAQDSNERAQRQDRLQRVETNFEALPFDASAARAYGRVYALAGCGKTALFPQISPSVIFLRFARDYRSG